MKPLKPLARILVVEDNGDIRELLCEYLEHRGYATEVAVNGFDALSKLQSGLAPDLILLDLTMPVMNGWSLREALLREPRWAKVPVIVVSALDGANPENVQASVTKPVDLARLLEAIKQLLP